MQDVRDKKSFFAFLSLFFQKAAVKRRFFILRCEHASVAAAAAAAAQPFDSLRKREREEGIFQIL